MATSTPTSPAARAARASGTRPSNRQLYAAHLAFDTIEGRRALRSDVSNGMTARAAAWYTAAYRRLDDLTGSAYEARARIAARYARLASRTDLVPL